MKTNWILSKIAFGLILFVCLLADQPTSLILDYASAAQGGNDNQGEIYAAPLSEGYVISHRQGEIVCRQATPEEVREMMQRGDEQQLQVITPVTDELLQQTGLRIILRGTSQLDGFPAAKNAFIKAAQTWESLIRNQITVIIDVDFGPTRFGQPFNANTVGSTNGQILGSNTIYPAVRSALVARASSAQELSLYNALPSGTVPTDIGSTAAMLAPSSLFRALGFINAVANPDTETQFGSPPSIGFNSAVSFDFDPSDGIDAGKFDFDTTAVHEIGHALGFVSAVGLKEIDTNAQVNLTVWDLFRFRPGVNLSNFGTAERILSSGGDHIFFDSGAELALSTGRPNGEGGDGKQAPHWKDDSLTGRYIGTMDPSLRQGQRDLLTENDLRAIDVMGYQLASAGAGAPTIALTQSMLDFGNPGVGTNADRLLTIRNTGAAVLNITGITSNNARFSVAAIISSLVIAPGGQETITIRFTPNATGNHTGTLTIASNDPARPSVAVQLIGTSGGSVRSLANVSAASFSGPTLAIEAIVASFGQNLATRLEAATSLPLPTSLAGTTVRIRDASGTERLALLFFVSPAQVNYQIPANIAQGSATVTITSGDGSVSSGGINIAAVAPGLFSANANGQGVAAAVALRVRSNGSQSFEPIARFDAGQNRFVPVPIDLGPEGEQVFLILFGTGIRFHNNLSSVSVKMGGSDAEVLFAGPQGTFAGLDQMNVRIPRSLIGRGEIDLALTVGVKTANIVRVQIR
jgi:uncharacterized protein (TIGR03437 family)